MVPSVPKKQDTPPTPPAPPTPPPEYKKVEEKTDITNHLLKDEQLAGVLNDACLNGTKEISVGEGETVTIPDYNLRIKAAEIELKLKGAFREKRQKSGLVDAIYELR